MMGLVEMSARGAVLILAAAAVRALAGDRLPKGTLLALWGVALARLLLPVSIPSPLSLYRLLDRAPVRAAPGGGTASAWTLAWALGAAATAAGFLFSWLRCRREFAASLPVENRFAADWLVEHPLRRKLSLRQLDGLPTSLTYGLLRPVILMPENTAWEDADRLAYILCHEFTHIRRWDGLWKLAATAALCVHWFNPAVWLLYVLLDRDIERACDAAVLCRCGTDRRADYARTLLELGAGRSYPAGLGFGKGKLEERIRSVMGFRPATPGLAAASLVLVALLAAGLATSAPDPSGPGLAAAPVGTEPVPEVRVVIPSALPDREGPRVIDAPKQPETGNELEWLPITVDGCQVVVLHLDGAGSSEVALRCADGTPGGER